MKLGERAPLWAPASALAGAELLAASLRAPSGSERAPLYAGASLLLLGAAALLTATLVGLLQTTAPDATKRPRTAAFAVAALLMPLAIVTARAVLLALFQRFHNRELAALVGAVLLLALAELARRSFDALVPFVGRRLPARAPWLAPLAAGLLGATLLAGVARDSGIAQLDRRLLLAPALGLGAFWLARRASSYAVISGRALVRFALLGLALTVAGSALGPRAVPWLARYGVWSRPAIAGLRALTRRDSEPPATSGGGSSLLPEPTASRLVPATVPRRPNLVLVTIETLRADHVSFLGYERPTTPELERLAARGFVFEQSYATTPTTRLSVAALLSGKLPSAIRWLPQDSARQMRQLAPETPWLPEILAQRGYATLAVHTDFRAFTRVENAGFERGFDHYDTTTRLAYSGGTMQGFPGEAQIQRALELLDASKSPKPFFLWLHLVEPHYLYEQSSRVPHFGTDERSLYDADIAEADRDVGLLARGLSQRGLLDSTVLLVTGDHGEEFGEHGQRWHGNNLYEAQVRTATLLCVPGLGARRIPDAVSFVDFAPTLLELLSIDDAFGGMMGRNLIPLLVRDSPPKPGIFLENFRVDNGQEALFARLEPPFKLVYDAQIKSYELYDLASDPAERRNLYRSEEPRSQRLAAELRRHLANDLAPGAITR